MSQKRASSKIKQKYLYFYFKATIDKTVRIADKENVIKISTFKTTSRRTKEIKIEQVLYS